MKISAVKKFPCELRTLCKTAGCKLTGAREDTLSLVRGQSAAAHAAARARAREEGAEGHKLTRPRCRVTCFMSQLPLCRAGAG